MCHPLRAPHLCRSNAASHLHSETLLPRCQSFSQVSLRLLRKRGEFGKAIKLSPVISRMDHVYFFHEATCPVSVHEAIRSIVYTSISFKNSSANRHVVTPDFPKKTKCITICMPGSSSMHIVTYKCIQKQYHV
jgi:hypothetical protein